jgi:hypothetical protein
MVGFDILRLVTVNTVFWDVMPCVPVEVHQHFREMYCLHLQGQGVSQERNQQEAGDKQSEPCMEKWVQL